MTTPLDARPSATTYDVERLVHWAWEGKIRVPHFQRDFRWGWEDVRRLFDSILKGYPIGSLLLWTRSAQAQILQLGALRIDASSYGEALWVVDGQQRLTSLANALHAAGQAQSRFAISYDLTEREFVHTPVSENPLIIPLNIIFDLQQILKWFAKYPGIEQYLDEATAITRTIRQYEVPAYLVSHDDSRVLQDIFDRMNNYGKRLSRAEVFAALNAGDENQQGVSLNFERIADGIDADLQFGKLDNDTVLQAILARRGPEVRRDIRNEFTKQDDEGRDAAYKAGEDALRRAIAFLQNHAFVPHISMMAYRYLLIVLTRVFAFYPEPGHRNLQLLRRWYWQAAIVGPEHFRGGTPNAARVLCSKITQEGANKSIQDLLKAIKPDQQPRSLDLRRFSTSEASTKMLLATWWSLNPRDPLTTRPYQQADLTENLIEQQTARSVTPYILPRRSVPLERRQWAAIRALMPGLEVDSRELIPLLSAKPVGQENRHWQAMLRSHGILPAMPGLLREGRYDDFLTARQGSLNSDLTTFLAKACEWEFENTPPLSSFVLDEDDDMLDKDDD